MGHKLEGRRAVGARRLNHRDRKPWRVRLWLPCARIDVVECDSEAEAFALTATRKDALNFEVFGPGYYRMTTDPLKEAGR